MKGSEVASFYSKICKKQETSCEQNVGLWIVKASGEYIYIYI